MTRAHTIGIIAESMADIHALRSVAMDAGLNVASSLEFFNWSPRQPFKANIDAWVINLNVEKLEKECPEKIDALMDVIPGMIILCEGGSPPMPIEAGYLSWKRRMMEKLQGLAGDLALASHSDDAPSSVWVLAGSVGGPVAIHHFLEALPPELGIAFVYANHLQKDFEQILAAATAQNSNYPAYVAQHGDVLAVNKVAVISPEFITTVMPNGTLHVSKQPWQGAYQPNLDYVVSSVAGTFGRTGGVIIFSGMCDDGAASCRIMKQNGGRVWVQRQDTCISSAMPDAALATGCVEKIGTPEQLANELVFWVHEGERRARAR